MSLITTPTLRLLYDRARPAAAHEHHTITFWMHLFNKIYFHDEQWVVAQEQPPNDSDEDKLRRIDINVSIAGNNNQLDVILICEGKRAGGSMYNVEGQAYQACEARCKNGGSVWAITVIGTTAQTWQYTTRPTKSFVSLTNKAYIDADDAFNAPLLHSHLSKMRMQLIPSSGHILMSQPAQALPLAQPPTQASSSSRYVNHHRDEFRLTLTQAIGFGVLPIMTIICIRGASAYGRKNNNVKAKGRLRKLLRYHTTR
jgi:hypothetical protein